jgi:hypothetical protein
VRAPLTSPATTPGRASARWFAAVIAAAFALLVAAGALNWWVDPFQHFRVAERYPPRYYRLLHRFVVPGIVRNGRYDTLLTGSSIVENTRNSTIGRACGGTGLNAAMPALAGYEQGLVLRTAFATHALKRAIVVVDFAGYNWAPEARHPLAGPLPVYLYDANPFNDAPYLLSWGVLVKSWRIVRGDASEPFRSDADAPWWWADQKRFGRGEVLRNLDPRDLNRQFPQSSLDLDLMRRSFDHNLRPLMVAHPETEFDVVWPPYSIIVWADYVQRHQLDTTLAFKRYIETSTRDLPNVRIVDLQSDAAVTHNLDNYTDLYHFSPAVNEWLIGQACGGGHSIRSEADVDATEREIRAQAGAFDPAGLAGAR